MRSIASLAALITVLSMPAPALALAPTDFAYGVPLTVQDPGEIHRVPLPADVYVYATRPDLGDMRVFNAAGEVVPYALRPQRRRMNKNVQPIAAFPIRAQRGTSAERVQLRLERNQSVTTIDLDTSDDPGEKMLRGYVLDARQIKQPLNALALHWGAPPADFTQAIKFEASDDLVHWRPVGRDAAIAHLRLGDNEIQRNRIDLPPGRYEFLRLMTEDVFPVNLVRVEAESIEEAAPATHWLAVVPTAGADGQYFVKIPGQIKAERFRIALVGPPYLSQVRVYSRSAKQRHWTERGAGAINRLAMHEKPVGRDEIAVAESRDREWQVRIMQAEGMGSDAPRIEVGWTPHELLFFGREPQPLQIAFGSAAVQPVVFPLNEFVTDVDPSASISLAHAGGTTALGGSPRREPVPAGIGMRLALWSLLGLGVVVLAVMAARLYRDLQKPPVS